MSLNKTHFPLVAPYSQPLQSASYFSGNVTYASCSMFEFWLKELPLECFQESWNMIRYLHQSEGTWSSKPKRACWTYFFQFLYIHSSFFPHLKILSIIQQELISTSFLMEYSIPNYLHENIWEHLWKYLALQGVSRMTVEVFRADADVEIVVWKILFRKYKMFYKFRQNFRLS